MEVKHVNYLDVVNIMTNIKRVDCKEDFLLKISSWT